MVATSTISSLRDSISSRSLSPHLVATLPACGVPDYIVAPFLGLHPRLRTISSLRDSPLCACHPSYMVSRDSPMSASRMVSCGAAISSLTSGASPRPSQHPIIESRSDDVVVATSTISSLRDSISSRSLSPHLVATLPACGVSDYIVAPFLGLHPRLWTISSLRDSTATPPIGPMGPIGSRPHPAEKLLIPNY